jgi:hypothetical protein
MDRVQGTNFYFYQRTNAASPWELETFPAPVGGANLTRHGFGRIAAPGWHYAGDLCRAVGRFLSVVSALTESNTSFAATPSPASNLVMATNANETISLSWTPGAGSAGSRWRCGPAPIWSRKSRPMVSLIPATPITGSGSALPGRPIRWFMWGRAVTSPSAMFRLERLISRPCTPTRVLGPIPAIVTLPQHPRWLFHLRGVSGAIVLNDEDVYINFTANPGRMVLAAILRLLGSGAMAECWFCFRPLPPIC